MALPSIPATINTKTITASNKMSINAILNNKIMLSFIVFVLLLGQYRAFYTSL